MLEKVLKQFEIRQSKQQQKILKQTLLVDNE